ncbi:MAG: DUF3787 domain-containing protein [Clostridiaceae bacterium]|nr:DUF3787 domain-containing protein [Clostridiaceae bacterium]
MAENRHKEIKMNNVIENHQTASWANIKSLKPISRVPIPDEVEVKNAKEWVDTNQK